MKTHFDYIISKVRLFFLGLTLATVTAVPAFAMIPIPLEVFQPGSITVASANDKKIVNNANYSSMNSSLKASNNKISAGSYKNRFLESDAENIPIIYLNEWTIIMNSNS